MQNMIIVEVQMFVSKCNEWMYIASRMLFVFITLIT